jgi:hypothetical protein
VDARRNTSRRPRRSVVLGSFGALAFGTVLSTTGLPAMANASSSTPRQTSPSTITRAVTSVRTTIKHDAPASARVRHAAVRRGSATTTRSAQSNSQESSVATTTIAPVTTTTVMSAPTVTPPALTISNPAANIAPNPDFLQTGPCADTSGTWSCDNPCVVGTASGLSWPGFTSATACTTYVLSAINNARAIEGIRSMVLPSNWSSLTTQEQLFVVANLERTARGLPAYVGINSALSADAQHSAQTNSDPSIAADFPIANDAQGSPGFGGAWSGGYSVLAADYVWMYDDAWGGTVAQTSNIACTSANAAGCWAHRDELLGSDPGYNDGVGLTCTTCEMGTGFAMVSGGASYVDLIEVPSGTPPAMSFTWANNVLPYLG